MTPLFLLSITPLLLGADATTQPAATVETPAPDLAPAPPKIEPVDQAFLAEAVRRQLESRLTGKGAYAPVYVPPALRTVRCPCFVTLRDYGALVAIGRADDGPLVEAVLAATDDALVAARKAGLEPRPESALAWSVEIELAGPLERVGNAVELPERLSPRFDPGIDGVAAQAGRERVYVRPSQIISYEVECRDGTRPTYRCDRYGITIQALREKLVAVPNDATRRGDRAPPALLPVPDASRFTPERVTFSRFRTTHFWQPAAGERPIELISGLRFVAPDEINADNLSRIIEETVRYIIRRQRPDGFFTYDYLPGRDRFAQTEENWVRQAATTWAMARYAARTNDPDARRCIERALAGFEKMAQRFEQTPHGRFIATPDNDNKLGTTALVGLAAADAPEPERHETLARDIAEAVCAMQTIGGRFMINFPPTPDQSELQDYSPGEAMLLLAKLYDRTREPQYRDVLDQGLAFYREFYRAGANPPFVIWQIQAFGQVARTTTLRRYADFVFEMADDLSKTQLHYDTPDAGPLRIYDGGMDVYGKKRSGSSTAPYIEAMLEALRTARAFGDEGRAERYAEVCRRAGRFIVQLRFRAEEAFYVRNPIEAIGGFRRSPFDHALRIDNNQHSMLALMGIRDMILRP